MITEWRGRYVAGDIEWVQVQVLDPAVWYLSRYDEVAEPQEVSHGNGAVHPD